MNPQEFLDMMATTANKYDFEAHMNLISKDVKVHGFPEFEEITYDDWYNQCKKEFEDRVLKDVSYQGLEIIAERDDRIMFQSVEIIEGSDGKENVCVIEFTIQKEDDGQWRVVQESILSDSVPDSEKN